MPPGEPTLAAVLLKMKPARKKREPRQHVTGIGGVFFKSQNPAGLAKWYRKHLGITSKDGCADFSWREKDRPKRIGRTVWALFPSDTDYFKPSASPFMLNYRVANLDRMLQQLRRGGVVVEKVESFNYGRFAWISDPEGNRIELWEPKTVSG